MSSDATVLAALDEGGDLGGRAASLAVRVLLPALTIVGLVGLWWLAVVLFGWKPFLVPTPKGVWDELVAQREILPGHVETTLVETLEGFALAIAIAVPVAVAIAIFGIALRATSAG